MEDHNLPPSRYDRRRSQQPQSISPPELYDMQQGPYSPTYNSVFRGTYFDSAPTQQSNAHNSQEYYGGQRAPAEVPGDSHIPYELPEGAYQGYQYDLHQKQTGYQGT